MNTEQILSPSAQLLHIVELMTVPYILGLTTMDLDHTTTRLITSNLLTSDNATAASTNVASSKYSNIINKIRHLILPPTTYYQIERKG